MASTCTCGEHKYPQLRTPQRERERVRFEKETKSEYMDNYNTTSTAWRVPRKSSAPPPTPKHEAEAPPFEGMTSHKMDYAPKPIPPKLIQPIRHKTLEHCLPHGSRLEGAASEYSARYQPKQIQPRSPPVKPRFSASDKAPFDDATTHRTAFQKWPLSIRAAMKPVGSLKDLGPFVDTTTYKAAYEDKSSSIQPKPRATAFPPRLPSTGPFYGETSYNCNFKLPPAPPLLCKCPAALTTPSYHTFTDDHMYY